MRRVSRHPAWIALLATLAAAAPAAAAAAPRTPPPVTARSAALYDPLTGKVMYGKQENRHMHVASLTKIMTAVLALKRPGNQKVTVRKDVLGLPQTIAGLVPGHTYTLGQLLPVLIVRSANDVAVAVADGVAGSVPAFVREMNGTAHTLGLKNTRYANPNGLDTPGEYSTARDVAVLAAVAMRDPAFRRLAALRSAALPGGPTFRSLNPFLSAYPGADGVKTGFTSDARFCLAASAVRHGRRLIAVVLGEPSFTAADRDAARLLDWGFAHAPPPRAAATRVKPPAAASQAGTTPKPASARAKRPDAAAAPARPAATPARPAPAAAPSIAHRPAGARLPLEPLPLFAAALGGAMLGLFSLYRARRAAGRGRRRASSR